MRITQQTELKTENHACIHYIGKMKKKYKNANII